MRLLETRPVVHRGLLTISLFLLCIAGFSACANQQALGTPKVSSCDTTSPGLNTIQMENSCPGTASWKLDKSTGPDDAIEAYAAPASVNQGEQIKLFVTTTAPTYSFQIFRMGWYQGLGARLVFTSPKNAGIKQPAPTMDPATRMMSASNWRSPIVIPIPMQWTSGVYVVKLLSSANYERYTLFTVRNDASHAAMLFQSSILTYQAYNPWGGRSLYLGRLTPQDEYTFAKRSYAVSFDRPYVDQAGLGHFPKYEYNLLRWMERSGYDMTYSTDIDTDLRGADLLNHRLFVAPGHDEYWSSTMRNVVTHARDAGVSLGFFGANDIYWHIRLQGTANGPDRIVVCYKIANLDPVYTTDYAHTTITWRGINDPENSLLGEMYNGLVGPSVPLVLASDATPLLAGSQLQPGASLPGLIGGEYDHITDNHLTPPGIKILSASPLHCQTTILICPPGGIDTAMSTVYTAKSGARVFDAGTFQWSWGLDDVTIDSQLHIKPVSNVGFQHFTANLFTWLLRS